MIVIYMYKSHRLELTTLFDELFQKHKSFINSTFGASFPPLYVFVTVFPIQTHWRLNLTIRLNKSGAT